MIETHDRMTRRDAAKYLGVAEQTLAVWAVTGRHSLPYTKIGRLAYYSRADLDAWLASRTGTSVAQIAAAVG